MIGGIFIAIVFIILVSALCSGGGSSSDTPTKRKGTVKKSNSNVYYDCSYSECPSCGAPYYDGYCEECGYPDINQGWLGENY